MRLLVRNILLTVVLSIAAFANAQPFASDIAAFKKQDSIAFPQKNQILFIGSSSFTKWKDVQEYFPNYPILNRGFGGSTLPDVIRYANDIIFPYQPMQIVIYCGDNDLASNDSITPAIVFDRFKTLFTLIRSKLPKVPIAYVSIKPSPSRWRLSDKMEETNKNIKDFLKEQKDTRFVDVYHKMLDENGRPISEIFGPDSLHMNAKGYAIWQAAIKKYLITPKNK